MTRHIGISVPHRRVDDDDDIQEYKKPWVGLTEEERNILHVEAVKNKLSDIEVIKAIEQALKRKNA
jgi:hypothetical protein